MLIVDDEPRLTRTLSIGLRAEGCVVVVSDNGIDGLHHAVEEEFDIILLDIMLPEMSGYEVLRLLRSRRVWTPVLMLTAKDGEMDQTDAFDLGADDYLTKPFSFGVLTARMRALQRRGAPERPTVMTAGSLVLDPARHTVTRGDATIDLTPREFGVLEYLMSRRGAVATKSDILHHVWDAHYAGPVNIIEVYVRYLRLKIDVPFGTNTIETMRGMGYRVTDAPDTT